MTFTLSTHIPALALAALLPAAGLADSPEIVAATAERVGMGWRIDVTLKHPDTGWDHYADAWEVLNAKGKVIAVRELMHPHVEEQPFTRSLINVMLPDGIQDIFIRGRCSEEGWEGEAFKLHLGN